MNILNQLMDALQQWSGDRDERWAASVFVVVFVVLMLVMLLAFGQAGMVDLGR